ncbi:unnamed protein product [Amoebophrya sp. A25]|nr:unnamed protein product [Amoebophrya sp. A25]|eukprot:GSA25T00003020001.1
METPRTDIFGAPLLEVTSAEMTRYSDNTLLKHREEFERYQEERSVKKWQQVKGIGSQVERVFAKSGITFNNGVAGGVVGESNKLDVPTTRERKS